MYFDRNENDKNIQRLHEECNRLMSFHVICKMKDGSSFDGIIESVDPDRVNVLVGEDVMDPEFENQYRQFGSQRRFRRFRRRTFPLAGIATLSLLQYPFFGPPFFFPF